MAFLPETIVSALLEPVIDRLKTALASEYQLRRDVPKEVGKLNLTLSMIGSFLEDAEDKQMGDKAVRKWLGALKQVILDADDVLDEYATRLALKSRGDDESSAPSSSNYISSIQRKVWKILNPCVKCFNTLPDILTSGPIAHSIRDIRERLDDINNNRSSLGLQVSSGTRRSEITTQRRRRRDTTSVLADESTVLGRDEDRQKIIQLLLLSSPNEAESSSTQRNVSVLPIVGMGGVGKTTLAQQVFNHKSVKEHFPLRMWVCMSNDFEVERVTKEIIESSSESNQDSGPLTNLATMINLDAIQHRLMKVLEGKLFLLVLDDVWNENDSPKWHSLLEPLKFGGKGSKVIVTTRSKRVADIIPMRMDSIILGVLSPDDLWKIFQKFAFGDTQMEHMQLEAIGKQIAEKLKGLPLAAKTVGCLLYSNLNAEHWRRIAQSDILALNQGEDDILPALKLSFGHLSACVKQCFTYCSLFPKDHIFMKDQLIQLWMAQCMIAREGGLEMEDIGRDYFDYLLSTYFFQPHHYSSHYVLMHDLIHDVADFESKDDCFRMGDVVLKDIPETIRHMSLLTDNLQPTKVINMCRYENLRTLLFLRGYKFDFSLVLNDLFTKLTRLRVLGFSGCRVEVLPESVGQLQHLRYMDLSNTPLKKLPESLCRLHNLQVLRLNSCYQLDALPKGITKLINLRHLVAEKSLISSIEGIGNLTSLHELQYFDASKHNIRELKGMNQLRELGIEHLEHVEGKEEARQVELNSKKWLKKLELGWGGDDSRIEDNRLDEEVLEGLQPNAADLKELIIRGFAGMSFPSWVMMGDQSLSILESITLLECGKVAFLPPMGQLPSLKNLEIKGMNGITEVGHEFYGSSRVMKKAFPSLESLRFKNMPEWEVWKGAEEEGQSIFPCLRRLVVYDCPKLMELPPLPPSMTKLWMESVGVTVLPKLQGTRSSTTTSSSQAPLSSSLDRLFIIKCPNLKDSITSEGALPFSLLPWLQNLESLTISYELLVFLPVTEGSVLPPSSLQHLTYLEIIGDDSITFDDDGLLLCRCLQSLTSLTSLNIFKCQSLTSLPGEVLRQLTSLNSMDITYCQQLTSLELPPLTSLTYLALKDCPKLMVITSSSPSPLTTLSIDNCSHLFTTGGSLLQSFPSLRSLKSLKIINCPQIQSLPTELGSLSSLKSLEIFNCPQMQSLPTELGSLSSLERLTISTCPQIQTLPTELGSLSSLTSLEIFYCSQIQSLPDIERLPASLNYFTIYCCPALAERCQRERGPDWHQISHISMILVNDKLI